MNFPTVTIPDPAAVGKWLDEQVPTQYSHRAVYGVAGWTSLFYPFGRIESEVATGDTPEALLADIQARLAANDPLAKLRKEAEAMGYGLLKLPQD